MRRHCFQMSPVIMVENIIYLFSNRGVRKIFELIFLWLKANIELPTKFTSDCNYVLYETQEEITIYRDDSRRKK